MPVRHFRVVVTDEVEVTKPWTDGRRQKPQQSVVKNRGMLIILITTKRDVLRSTTRRVHGARITSDRLDGLDVLERKESTSFFQNDARAAIGSLVVST